MKNELMTKLLWSTIEDYAGLWELNWEVNSILEKDYTCNMELTKKILLHLLQIGLIKLYFNKWGEDQIQEIRRQEAIEVLENEEYWSPPKLNDLCIKTGSTKKGEKYYYEDLISEIEL